MASRRGSPAHTPPHPGGLGGGFWPPGLGRDRRVIFRRQAGMVCFSSPKRPSPTPFLLLAVRLGGPAGPAGAGPLVLLACGPFFEDWLVCCPGSQCPGVVRVASWEWVASVCPGRQGGRESSWGSGWGGRGTARALRHQWGCTVEKVSHVACVCPIRRHQAVKQYSVDSKRSNCQTVHVRI